MDYSIASYRSKIINFSMKRADFGFKPLYSGGFSPYILFTISIGLPILYLRDHTEKFLNYDVFLSMTVVLILANNAYPGDAVFHLGLHCWYKR